MATLMGVVPLVICYLISFIQARVRLGSVIVPRKPPFTAEKTGSSLKAD